MNFSPAYHLRTNKAVERLLFIELLHRLDRALLKTRSKPIENYVYVGLGGPYLEDFNLIHATFGNRKMISLEEKKHILTRQALNQPYSRITLTDRSTRDYVDALRLARSPLIVWFDYESPKWKDQLTEFCDLIQKVPAMSILKITLTGSTRKLNGRNITEKAEAFTKVFEDYGNFSSVDIKPERICDTLQIICRKAIADSAPDTRMRCVRSLSCYRYNDGTPVLTITMIVGVLARVELLIEEIAKWPFADTQWGKPKELAVPALSLREKLAVDQLLPDAQARTVINKLGLRFADRYEDSIAVMANYVQLYRHVPHFVRVTL